MIKVTNLNDIANYFTGLTKVNNEDLGNGLHSCTINNVLLFRIRNNVLYIGLDNFTNHEFDISELDALVYCSPKNGLVSVNLTVLETIGE